MKMRWLNYILNRRRARFFPWDVLVANVRESEADVHALDSEEDPDNPSGTVLHRPSATGPTPRANEMRHSLGAQRVGPVSRLLRYRIDDVRRNGKCCRGLIAGQGGST